MSCSTGYCATSSGCASLKSWMGCCAETTSQPCGPCGCLYAMDLPWTMQRLYARHETGSTFLRLLSTTAMSHWLRSMRPLFVYASDYAFAYLSLTGQLTVIRSSARHDICSCDDKQVQWQCDQWVKESPKSITCEPRRYIRQISHHGYHCHDQCKECGAQQQPSKSIVFCVQIFVWSMPWWKRWIRSWWHHHTASSIIVDNNLFFLVFRINKVLFGRLPGVHGRQFICVVCHCCLTTNGKKERKCVLSFVSLKLKVCIKCGGFQPLLPLLLLLVFEWEKRTAKTLK